MHESPRVRRLRSDFAAMERLRSESSVLRFRANGTPAQHYIIEFRGKSLARFQGKVTVREHHEVEIKLGASYPRTMPELRWLSPIYHPNISEIGMVCLGGYGTHWVPGLNLDELCCMLWDMARFHNYDVRSPYNREAALWVANQTTFKFPLDARPLRDLRQALGRLEEKPAPPPLVPKPNTDQRGTLAEKYRGFLKRFQREIEGDFEPTSPQVSSRVQAEEVSGQTPDQVREPLTMASKLSLAAATLAEADIERSGEVVRNPEQRVERRDRPGEVVLSEQPSRTRQDESASVEANGHDLVILESIEDHPIETRPPEPRPVRLRAADQEIVFLD